MNGNNSNSVSQERVETNPVTANILKRHGFIEEKVQDSKVTGDKEIVKDKPADPPVEKQTQSNDNDLTITDAEFEALAKAGIKEEDLDGKSIAEIKQLAKDNTKQQENSQVQGVVTEEMVKGFGFAKNLIGKPIADVLKIIDNQNQYIGILKSQQPASKTEPVSKTEPTQQITNKKETKEESKATDKKPVDLLNMTPEQQAEYIAQIKKEAVQEALQELKTSIIPSEDEVTSRAEDYKKAWLEELGKNLPEGVDPASAFEDWKKNEGSKAPKEVKEFYVRNPEKLITDIVKDLQLRKLKTNSTDNAKKNDSEVKQNSYERVRKALLHAKSLGHGAVFNFRREGLVESNALNSNTGSEGEKMIGRIIERNLPRK